jgi:hypothetical protein
VSTAAAADARNFAHGPARACVAAAVLLMVLAAFAYLPTPRRAFMSEGAPVPWLSTAILLLIAVLCVAHAVRGTLSRPLALWLCAAMLVLAADQQFRLHELWKTSCLEWTAACGRRVFAELPIILVAVLGIATAWKLHGELEHPSARTWLWWALGVGVFSVFLDLVGVRYVGRYEKGFEVLAEALFAGMLVGLRRGSRAA